MVSNNPRHLLFIEPRNTTAQPVIDEMTRKIAAAFRQAAPPHIGYKGIHGCTGNGCGALSSNLDYMLPNGLLTNSLCVHYLAFHRDEVPESEMAKVRELYFGEVEPTDKELAAPRQPR